MKKYVKLVLIIAACVVFAQLFFSCSRSEKTRAHEEDEETVEASGNASLGVVLDRASVWELQSDGKLKWAHYINAGETVEWTGEKRALVNTSNNRENEYYHVFAGGDYWIRDYAVAGPAVPGVIQYRDTVLYSQPDLGSIVTSKNKTIRRYSIVAVYEQDLAAGFSRISAHYVENAQYRVVDGLWVKTENISTHPNDVKAISLYQLALAFEDPVAALASEDPVVKRELLNNALSISDTYSTLIERALIEMDYDIESIAPRVFTVNEEQVDLLDRPNADYAKTIDWLDKGQKVTAIAKTKNKVSRHGISDYYYKIDGYESWVFGAYLSEEKAGTEE